MSRRLRRPATATSPAVRSPLSGAAAASSQRSAFLFLPTCHGRARQPAVHCRRCLGCRTDRNEWRVSMAEKRLKLTLDDLKVQSFVTTLNNQQQLGIRGG